MKIAAKTLILSIWVLTMSSSAAATTVETYDVPQGAPTAKTFRVEVNGTTSGVFTSPQGLAFTVFSFGQGTVDVKVKCSVAVKDVVVRPLSARVKPEVNGNVISFELAKPRKLSVEVNGKHFLFMFADPLETKRPKREGKNVLWYGPGLHDLGGKALRVKSGQTLYLSGGAYLTNSPSLVIQNAGNVRVCGRGVFAGNTRIANSRHVEIEGITINPAKRSWMNKIDCSQYVTYRNFKAINGNDTVPNFDGFDVMSGCHAIIFDDIFLRGTDDCLTIKHHPSSPNYWMSKAPVSHVTMQNAVLWNVKYGTTFRIGPETIGPSIERITMKNIDVIHTSVGFEILPVDGVRVNNILLEDIRIENHGGKLVQFDLRKWYKVGPRQGLVNGVYLRHWDIQGKIKEWHIQSASKGHGFKNVFADGFRLDGKLIKGRPEAWGKGAAFNRDAKLPTDRTVPQLTDAAALTTQPDGAATIVYVVFSEPVTQATAEDVGNYVVSDGGRVEKAQWDYHFQQVVLTTSPIAADSRPALTVKGVRDLNGNTIKTKTVALTMRRACKASDGFAAFQGKFGWWYEQVSPTEVQLYNNRKDITRPPQTYWLANYYTQDKCWLAHRENTKILPRSVAAGETYYAVRTWMAPAKGRVLIKGKVRAKKTADVRIVSNREATRAGKDDNVLLNWQNITAAKPLQYEVQVDVDAGSVIRFIVRNGAADWDPAVQY